MAIVEHGGVLRIDEAVDYFIKYYGQRKWLAIISPCEILYIGISP